MKKSVLNSFSGVALQLITMSVGFVIPRLFLLRYGSEINGLISSTNQLLSYLGLFEAGVGSASIQALYGLISRHDISGINGIMSATNQYYKKTAWYYLSGTIALALIYPFLINTNISAFLVFFIVASAGIAGAISFFTYSKLSLLLNAENNIYYVNGINLITVIVSSLVKIILIRNGTNIYVLQSFPIIYATMQAILYYILVNKKYSWLNLDVPPDNESIAQKNAALMHQVAGLISSNTDMLLITFFIGLKSVSVYGLYNLVFSAIASLINNLYSGIRSKLGQLYNSNLDRYSVVYKKFEILYTSISCSAIGTAYIMVLPFVRKYTMGVHDINYCDARISLLFTIIQILIILRLPIFDTVYFAGYIKATRWHTASEAIINLGCSLLLIKPLGIYGVLIGTIIALTIRTIIGVVFVQKQVKIIDLRQSMKVQILNTALFAGVILGAREFQLMFSNYFQILFGIVKYGIILFVLFVSINVMIFRSILTSRN